MFRNRVITNIRNYNIFRTTLHKNTFNGPININHCHYKSMPKKIENDPKQFLTSKYQDRKPNNILNNKLTDEEYFLKVKHNPDEFGRSTNTEVLVDEDDIKEEKYFTEQPLPQQKLSTKQYADMIKAFIDKRQIKEAINVLEVRMIKEDRVKPEDYIYNLLIGACGRVGYTKKAFKLYNQMKERGYDAMGGTYTALFNACSNSPFTEESLKQAIFLREKMVEKMYEPNETNYNAMIKAFGRCGDINTAFEIADEMIAKKYKLTDATISFLLQSCISDKEAGFRHALLVWRKSVERRIKPSLFMYNLMLRCVRDCGIGDIQVTEDVIKRIVGKNEVKLLGIEEESVSSDSKIVISQTENSQALQLSASNEIVNKNVESINFDFLTPNLMARIPHMGNIVSLSEVTKAEHRLLLVGGVNGFLENMRENKCRPDIKTYTQLMDNIPGTVAAEQKLLQSLRKDRVEVDVDFYNMLMKRRSMRCDYESAKEVLHLMRKSKMEPDLISYGILALGCKTRDEALELLDEMNHARYSINVEILGAMLHQACYHKNITYVLTVLEICLRDQIEVGKMFLEKLVNFRQECRRFIKSGNASKTFEKDFMVFRMRYKDWLTQVQIDKSEEMHPWDQYEQTTEGNVRYKENDGERFKKRHASLFKVKTSPKYATDSNKKHKTKRVVVKNH